MRRRKNTPQPLIRLVAEVKTKQAWYYEVSKCNPQEALRNLEKAYKRFFKGLGGFPKFKKKGVRDSFYVEGKIKINKNRIKLPKFGWAKLSETLDSPLELKNVTISKTAGQWLVSFKTDTLPVAQRLSTILLAS